MAVDVNATKLQNLFDPEVVGALVEKKLTDAMKFSPLARVDTTLEGQPGSIIKLPSFAYIGDASTVAEGADVDISQLTSSTKSVSIHKIAKAVEVTDEAMLSAYGDPAGETVKQLTISIGSQLDNEMLTTLDGATLSYTIAGSTAGVYTVTIGGTVASGDKIVVDGVETTLDGTSGASATAAATAVAAKTYTNYTATSSSAVVTLTEKTASRGYGQPVAKITSTAGTIAVAVTTKPGDITADDIADALVAFGEDIEGEKVLLVSPTAYAVLRKADDWCPASEIAANMIIEGSVGMIHGCQVVVSNKLKMHYYIVKPGALALYMKRNVQIKTDEDIVAGSTVLVANQHFATYLYDESKAIKIIR